MNPQSPSLPSPWLPTTPVPRTLATARTRSSRPAAASLMTTATLPAAPRSTPPTLVSALLRVPSSRTASRAAALSTPTPMRLSLLLRLRSLSRVSKEIVNDDTLLDEEEVYKT